MTTPQPKFVPQVYYYRDEDCSTRPAIVFRKGRTLYHAVVSTEDAIKLETFTSLRGFTPMPYRGSDAYPPRKAESYWLNHDHRPMTKRARAILKGLVARKPKGLDKPAEQV